MTDRPPRRLSIDATPEMVLEEALRDLREGRENYNKMIIMTLLDDGKCYDTNYYCAGMDSKSAAVALCEISKMMFLRDMGGIFGLPEDGSDGDV